jgi:hypothetical protein
MGHRSQRRTALAIVTALLATSALAGGCSIGPRDRGGSAQGSSTAGYAEASGRPTRIAINHNAFEAKHIGHTADGRQFFLTRPSDPGTDGADDARDFVALYLFDEKGQFLDAEIDAVDGANGTTAASRQIYQNRLKELGKVTVDRIEVEPFAVKRFGTTFGLIVRAPQKNDDIWWVTAGRATTWLSQRPGMARTTPDTRSNSSACPNLGRTVIGMTGC